MCQSEGRVGNLGARARHHRVQLGECVQAVVDLVLKEQLLARVRHELVLRLPELAVVQARVGGEGLRGKLRVASCERADVRVARAGHLVERMAIERHRVALEAARVGELAERLLGVLAHVVESLLGFGSHGQPQQRLEGGLLIAQVGRGLVGLQQGANVGRVVRAVQLRRGVIDRRRRTPCRDRRGWLARHDHRLESDLACLVRLAERKHALGDGRQQTAGPLRLVRVCRRTGLHGGARCKLGDAGARTRLEADFAQREDERPVLDGQRGGVAWIEAHQVIGKAVSELRLILFDH